jgi:hypothetical protein
MKLPRFTTRDLGIAIAIFACDLVVVMNFAGTNQFIESLTTAVLGALPMASLLAFIGLSRRGRSEAMSPFLAGFVHAGWWAAGVFVALALIAPDGWYKSVACIVNWCGATFTPYESIKRELNSHPFTKLYIIFVVFGTLAVIYVLPQLLVAFAGGRAAQRKQFKPESERRP